MPSQSLYVCAAVLCGVGLSVFLTARRRRDKSLPLPPGPPQHPILGNTADIPEKNQWVGLTEMGKKYGPVVHLRMLHRHMILLNSWEAVTELLDRRGGIYSDRPAFPMVCGLDWATSLMRYGERWRANRRIVHYYFHEQASKRYHDSQTRMNLAFLLALLDTPRHFMQHIRSMTAASIMKLTYDIDISTDVDGGEDPWVALAHSAIEIMTAAVVFGTFAVDWIPLLKYVPAWFPGAAFQRLARESREISKRFRLGPLEMVRERISQGKSSTSIAEQLIRDGLEGRPLDDGLVADATAIIYIGGADTTVSVISAFFLCMVLHPAAQKAAHEEIDRVLGPGCLPTLADRRALPYVSGVLLEVMRLYPVLPLGTAHRVMEEDEYDGMRIPKGATILANVWSILRDEHYYADPERFMPERYTKDGVLDLKNTVLDPRGPVFGFGRHVLHSEANSR
ncbi:cytochrome P450 [Auricularia subglabra TFB-10046 SS5]|nr:cytochrome P450 [Auricularia subglabra TFB-10046 SS5]